METEIKVGDVMSKGVVTISPGASVKEACEIMAKHDFSGLTVMEGGKVSGVLTQGDVIKMIAAGANAMNTHVSEFMGKEAHNIGPDADIYKAAKLMVDKKVKRLLVLKDGKLVGVLTQADIVRISPSVYDLIFEKAKVEAATMVETELPLSGECEECGNYSDDLKNAGGTLMCGDCFTEYEEQP